MDYRRQALACAVAALLLPAACADETPNLPPISLSSVAPTRYVDDCDVHSGDASRDNLMAYVCAAKSLLAAPASQVQQRAPTAPTRQVAAASPPPAPAPPIQAAPSRPQSAPPAPLAPVAAQPPASGLLPSSNRDTGRPAPAPVLPGVQGLNPAALSNSRAWQSPIVRNSRLYLVPPDADMPQGAPEYVYILLDITLPADREDSVLRRGVYCPLWETQSDTPPAADQVIYVVPVRAKPAAGAMPEYDHARAHAWLTTLKRQSVIPLERSLDGTAFVVDRTGPMSSGIAINVPSQIGRLSPADIVNWMDAFRNQRETASPLYPQPLVDVTPDLARRLEEAVGGLGKIAEMNIGLKFPGETSLACDRVLPAAKGVIETQARDAIVNPVEIASSCDAMLAMTIS